jgi:hypothetical protein
LGTIKAGFWTVRALVSAEEFSEWIDLCKREGFYFKGRTLDNPLLDFEEVKAKYRNFYIKRMDSVNYHKQVSVPYADLYKDGFNHAISLGGNQWRFWWKDDTTTLDDAFVTISSCKQYSVTSDCGKHFTYEDILQREPLAKEYFYILTKPLKSITTPLYQHGKPMYSARISKQAYIDLLNSAFNKNMREPLTSKWKL